MRLVDAIFEYANLGSTYFTTMRENMVNDAFLGLSAVAVGLVAWLIRLLLADPKGRLKETFK